MNRTLITLIFLISIISAKAQTNEINGAAADTTVYVATDNPPTFPGGIERFNEYIGKNIRYPAKAFLDNAKGKVIISVIIEKDGSLSNAKVIRSVSPELDSEAQKVVILSPKWNCATQNGKPVRFAYVVPVKFNIAR
jgi:protein TonB